MLDLAKTREFRDFVLIRGNNLTEFWQFREGPEVISNRLWIHKCRSYACGLNHKPCKTFKNPRAFARSEQSPTLNKAIGIGQQHELSQSPMKLMRSEEILSIKQKHVPLKQKKDYVVKLPRPQKNCAKPSTQSANCNKCGRLHKRGKCPALGSKCSFCKKRNHWQVVCNQKQRGEHVLYEDDSESELLCINTTQPAHETNHSSDKWLVNLQVNGTVMPFRIDNGLNATL